MSSEKGLEAGITARASISREVAECGDQVEILIGCRFSTYRYEGLFKDSEAEDVIGRGIVVKRNCLGHAASPFTTPTRFRTGEHLTLVRNALSLCGKLCTDDGSDWVSLTGIVGLYGSGCSPGSSDIISIVFEGGRTDTDQHDRRHTPLYAAPEHLIGGAIDGRARRKMTAYLRQGLSGGGVHGGPADAR